MTRLKKRNNYTLSTEAQEIIDKVKNKSKFVSEAIVGKGCEHDWQAKQIGNHTHNYEMVCSKCGATPTYLISRGTVAGNNHIVDTETICNHVMEFHPDFYGCCPQPKICTKCGKIDNNGYNGNRYI